MVRKRTSKKLLVASMGVATVSFVGCPSITLGNLVAPEPCTSADAAPGCYPPWDAGEADGGEADAGEDGQDAGSTD
ncbi:MAG: hypothetical protein H6730_05595 [Deltaproteobacteria bacterium]|nr:hypothetical protein [Deltaproteobacteria bacterium]